MFGSRLMQHVTVNDALGWLCKWMDFGTFSLVKSIVILLFFDIHTCNEMKNCQIIQHAENA